jgi:hypothetical protein
MPFDYARVDDDDIPIGVLKYLRYYTDITQLDSDSEPTLNDVTDLIDQVEAEINGVLSAEGYATVPATGSDDINLLRGYVERKASYEAFTLIYGPNELPSAVKRWHDAYQEFLARLRRGEQYLPNQQPQSEDEPFFLTVRTTERDDYFTYRTERRDYDEP